MSLTRSVLCVLESNSWADFHLAGSLEDMGHKVTRFFYGNAVGEFYGRSRAAERQRKNDSLVSQAEQLVRENSLDLIFCYVYDDFLLPETARRLAALDVPFVNLNVDMVNQWYRQSRTAKYFTRVLCAHTQNMDSLARHGANTMYFPMAGRRPTETPELPFMPAAPVTFLGTPTSYRKRVLGELDRKSFPLAIYGKFWDENKIATAEGGLEKLLSDLHYYGWSRLRAEGPGSLLGVLHRRLGGIRSEVTSEETLHSCLQGYLPNGAMNQLFKRSKVNLGFTRMLGEDPSVPGVCQVKLRDFEIPLAGGFYLVEEAPDYDQLFECGNEVVTWRNTDDLCDKLAFYLEHEEERLRIAKAGQLRAMKDHTWDVRFNALFSELGLAV